MQLTAVGHFSMVPESVFCALMHQNQPRSHYKHALCIACSLWKPLAICALWTDVTYRDMDRQVVLCFDTPSRWLNKLVLHCETENKTLIFKMTVKSHCDLIIFAMEYLNEFATHQQEIVHLCWWCFCFRIRCEMQHVSVLFQIHCVPKKTITFLFFK